MHPLPGEHASTTTGIGEAVSQAEVRALSDLAARLSHERPRDEAVAALVQAADDGTPDDEADRLYHARLPFLLRLHADASDVDASRALAVIERAARLVDA